MVSNVAYISECQEFAEKMSELLTTVSALSPYVIGITESWGNSDISYHEFSICGFTMLRSDRESDHRGGGVVLFVKNEMHPVEVKMESKFTDQVWCKIQNKQR